MEYDLQNGATSNEKPTTGKQKRQQKALKEQHKDRDHSVQQSIESGKAVEVDAVKIIPKSEYVMPPFVPGYINVDGLTEKGSEIKSES